MMIGHVICLKVMFKMQEEQSQFDST